METYSEFSELWIPQREREREGETKQPRNNKSSTDLFQNHMPSIEKLLKQLNKVWNEREKAILDGCLDPYLTLDT